MRPELLAVVTARAGSRRLPGKNMVPLFGVPMVGLACRVARAARCVTRTFLSTDDAELARVGREHGAEVPFLRPAHLASDSASSYAVLAHVLAELAQDDYRPEYVLLLQPSTPLRLVEDIDAAFARLLAEQPNGAIISVSAAKPPSWTEVQATNGLLSASIAPVPLPADARWVMPNGGFYIAHADYLVGNEGFDGPATLGQPTDALLYIDIDTDDELDRARRLIAAGLATPPPGAT